MRPAADRGRAAASGQAVAVVISTSGSSWPAGIRDECWPGRATASRSSRAPPRSSLDSSVGRLPRLVEALELEREIYPHAPPGVPRLASLPSMFGEFARAACTVIVRWSLETFRCARRARDRLAVLALRAGMESVVELQLAGRWAGVPSDRSRFFSTLTACFRDRWRLGDRHREGGFLRTELQLVSVPTISLGAEWATWFELQDRRGGSLAASKAPACGSRLRSRP